MVGAPKKEDIGKTRECKLCGSPFTVRSHRKKGGTFKLCPHCSYCVDSKNYKKLTTSERKLRAIYARPYTLKYYLKNKFRLTYENLTKKWRQRYHRKWRDQRDKTRDRHQEETLELASNYYSRWDSSDIAFLRKEGKKKTIRELAVILGRSYQAVQARAILERIPLLTEDKKHGRLVTRLKVEGG